jgi:hypothetical protein
MNTKARVILTMVLGIAMGVTTWLSAEWSSPPGSGYVLWTLIILVPLIVGRWWVLAALAGQFIALVALQLTGHMVHGLDGHEEALSSMSIVVGLVIFGLFMLILVGIRKAFDLWRDRGVTANS